MATSYTDQVQKVYIAYYGRAADPVGLAYWAAKVETDGLAGIMASFGASAEATTLFGSLTNTAMVNALYKQSFGRDADFAGLMHYSGHLTAGTMTAATIAQNIFDGATGTDATILTNKLIVAKAYTDAIDTASEVVAYSGTVAAASARALLTTVDAATVTASFDVATSVASIVSVSEATPAVSGSALKLTATTDVMAGTAGNDTITGVLQAAGVTGTTAAPGDTVTGGAGVDTLTVSVAGALASATPYTLSALSTVGVEKVYLSNFETTENATHTVDTALMTGLTHLGLSSSAAEGDSLFTNVKNIVVADMSNGAADLTLTYGTAVVAGTTDAQTLNASNLSGGQFQADGIETITVNTQLVKSTMDAVKGNAITNLTLTGDQNLTISESTTFAVLTDTKVVAATIDASAMTGTMSVLVGDTSTVKVTGGSGADTINMAGTLETNDIIDGGAGVDILTMNAATLTTQFTNVTNVETVAFNKAAGGTMAAAKFSVGVDTIIFDSKDDTDDTGLSANIANGLSGETVVIRHTESDLGADDNGDGNSYVLTNATDTAADTISVTLDGIGTKSGAANTSWGVTSIDVNAFETVNIASTKNTVATTAANGSTAAVAIGGVTLNTLDLLTVSGTTKTVAITGAAALTITDISGSVMTSLDASGMTAAFIGTLSVADDLAVKLPDVASTINFGSTLNNADSVVGGAGTTDVVTATVTGLIAASTGALTISAVESINLTTSGANAIVMTGVTGATTLAVTDNVQTITGLDLATTIHLNGANSASEIDVTATDATGSSDTLKVSTTGATISIIDASAIETLALIKNDAGNTVTLDLTTFDGGAITLASKAGITGTAAVALGNLNAAANSLTSTYANTLSASFVNATGAATATVAGTNIQSITGSGFADTFNVGSTTAITHVIAGGAGEDTINLTHATDASAEFGSMSAIQTFNLALASGADVVVNGAFHADVDDITVTGGNTTSTLTSGTLGGGVETLDASAFQGNILATVADDSLDTTVIFTGGDLATDKVLNTVATAATTYALKSTGVELLDLDINAAAATTVSLAAATGVTGVSVDMGANVAAITTTITNVTNEVITLKAADDNIADHTLAASLVSAVGTSDTIAFKIGAGTIDAGVKLKTDDIETVSINANAAATVDLSLLAMTTAGKTMALTVTGKTALTISALGADVTSIDATGMAVGGSVVMTARSSTDASTYTGSAGADTFFMNHKGDTITGGAGSDTLDINFAGILGGVAVDLTAADQVGTMDGATNTAIQTGFLNVDLNGFTGFGASVTGTSKANTITGTPGVSVDSLNGGAGNDTFVYPLTLDLMSSSNVVADSVIGGSGTDTLSVGTSGTAFAIASNEVFGRMTSVESIVAVANSVAVSINLDSSASTTGITTVDISLADSGANGSNLVDASEITTTTHGFTLKGSALGAGAILGGSGADTITGGAAIDIITPGPGKDTMTGGGAADVFHIVTATAGSTLALANTITDFTTAVDDIDVGTAASFTEEDGAAFTEASFAIRAAIAFDSTGTDAFIAFNAAGSGNAWLLIDHDAGGTVTAADTFVILNGINQASEFITGDII